MALDAVKLAQHLVARGDYAAVPEWQIAADLNQPRHAARRALSGPEFKRAAVECRAWGALAAAQNAAAVNLAAMAETGAAADAVLAADLDDALAAGTISQAQRDALWAAGDTLISNAERDGIVARGERVESGDVSRARPDAVVGTVYEGLHPESGARIATQDKATAATLDRLEALKYASARTDDAGRAALAADIAAAETAARAALAEAK